DSSKCDQNPACVGSCRAHYSSRATRRTPSQKTTCLCQALSAIDEDPRSAPDRVASHQKEPPSRAPTDRAGGLPWVDNPEARTTCPPLPPPRQWLSSALHRRPILDERPFHENSATRRNPRPLHRGERARPANGTRVLAPTPSRDPRRHATTQLGEPERMVCGLTLAGRS